MPKLADAHSQQSQHQINDLLDGLDADDFGAMEPSSDPPGSEPVYEDEEPFMLPPADMTSFPVGFVTGRKTALPQPSEVYLNKARKLIAFDEYEVEEPGMGMEAGPSSPKRVRFDAAHLESTPKSATRSVNLTTSFTTASGRAVPPPSEAAQKTAFNLINTDSSPPLAVSGITSASGKAVKGSTAQTLSHVATLFGDGDLSVSGKTISLPPTEPHPYRTPLRPTTNTFSTPTPARSQQTSSLRGKPISIQQSTIRRRIGLGGTPSRNKSTSTFVTPFRSAPTRTAARISSAVVHSSISKLSETATSCRSVFDIQPPESRKSYREAYLKPQYLSINELKERQIPEEIFQVGIDNAQYYHFEGPDETQFGPSEARVQLLNEGCRLISIKWIVNHWCLILWKLAGIVQAQPGLFETIWSYEHVIIQLKYRYEREFNLAQRPLIRKIHEHDAGPGVPMILCVTKIHHPPLQHSDKGEPPAKPYLELTDGWYRILAEVDDCLARAVGKGRIAIGRKLAISGAKLESGGDGVEALDALEKSRLVISGNSARLAPWDAVLGAQFNPFISGLSSLSVDGGIVTLMDVVLDKVFPLAFMSTDKNIKEGPWDEEEERKREEQWTDKYTSESIRLQNQMRKQLEKLEDLTSSLCVTAESSEEGLKGVPPDNIDDIFERVLEAPIPDVALRRMSSNLVMHLAMYARSYLEKESSNMMAEVEAELQVTCPQRDVRDFRVVKFRDARLGNKAPCREGMLNVWEARSLGSGAFEEGKRYLVSNLMPGRSGDWRLPRSRQEGNLAQVYLHTRRDTRWQEIEE